MDEEMNLRNLTGKFADFSYMGHESDFMELVWENGKLLIRGRSDPHDKSKNQCQGEILNDKKSSSLQRALSVLFPDFEHNGENYRAPNRLEGVPVEAPASDGNVPNLTSLKHCQVSAPTRKTDQTLIPFSGSANQHENREKTITSAFVRPKFNLNPNHLSSGTSTSGLSAAEGFNGNDNKHATGRGSCEFGPKEPASALEERRIRSPGGLLDSADNNLKPSPRNNPPKEFLPDEQSESSCYKASCKIKSSNDVLLDPSSSLVQNTSKRTTTVRNDVEQLVESSCGSSNDLSYTWKRKREDNDSYTSEEDVPKEQHNCLNKVPDQLSKGRKGSRVPEAHNLSEKQRRAKINKKMRALQELIPNCSKVDKASLLDEAIEYLKVLQLQVQMMAMGTVMFNPGLMLPTAMQHLNAPHLGNYSALANIMPGMRMQMLGGCSPLQVPHSLIPRPSSPPGVSEAQPDVACFPSQALPMPVTHSPFLFLPQMASPQYVQAAQNAPASGQLQLQKPSPLPAGNKRKYLIGK